MDKKRGGGGGRGWRGVCVLVWDVSGEGLRGLYVYE